LRVAAFCQPHPRVAIQHDPRDPYEDDGDHHCDGTDCIQLPVGTTHARHDHPQLQTDEDECEHVQDEYDSFPNRVRGEPVPRVDPARCELADGHRMADERNDGGQAQVIGQQPDAERAHELQDDGHLNIAYVDSEPQVQPRECYTDDDTANAGEQQ